MDSVEWKVSGSDSPDSIDIEWTIALFGLGPEWRDHLALVEIEEVTRDIAERHELGYGTAGHLVTPPDVLTETVLPLAEIVADCSVFTAPEEIMRRIDALRSALKRAGYGPFD